MTRRIPHDAEGAATVRTFGEPQGIAIARSPSDTRDYRGVMLDNKLEALVVSDPGADKAAAALNISVGSANDPDDRPGLAHFLEHMLVLGTRKYPDPEEYGRFLKERGGGDNAATSFAHTSYFFDVDAAHLEGALDRFAQSFISPQFDRACVERERRVVHSEYISRRRSDRLRSLAAWRQALDPRHPASRFLVGNEETLADRPCANVRDELVDFYERRYSSHLMKLAVVGREPLDVLEDRVRTLFTEVPRRNFEPPRIVVPLYPEGLLPARLDIQPLREIRTISLSFPIPPVRPHHRAHPFMLVSHLLGHEGRGSLLSALKTRGWAEGLNAGLGMRHRDFATFGITIHATEAGVAHLDDVLAWVFASLDLIRERGIDPLRYEELARVARIGFRFQAKTEPRSHMVSLASTLHFYPIEEALTAPWRFDDFDPGLVRLLLSALTSDRVLVAVMANGARTDSVAPFYETPYRLSPVPTGTRMRWQDPPPTGILALPEPNPFLPGRTVLIDEPQAGSRPTQIVSAPGLYLWHRADVEFGQPQTNFYFSTRSPVAADSPRHAILCVLLARVVNDALNEVAYTAALAGQTCALSRHRRGLTVRLSGWSDKQDLLLARIAATLRAPPLSAKRFDAEKTEYLRQLRNVDESKPFRRAMRELRTLLIEPGWTNHALLEALDAVELEDLREYAAKFFERGEIVALAHGNVTAEDAKALGAVLERDLLGSMRAVRVAQPRVARLMPGTRFTRCLAGEHPDHALAVYVQGRDSDLTERARFLLMVQATSGMFFDELRTEHAIGYIVSETFLPMLEVPGLALVVQSATIRPEDLYRYVDCFIRRCGAALHDMPPAAFERHRGTVENSLVKAELTLGERTVRYWGEIASGNYEFCRRDRLLEAVRAISREDLAEAWRDLVASPETVRRVVVAVSRLKPRIGGETFGGSELLTDPVAFKRGQVRWGT